MISLPCVPVLDRLVTGMKSSNMYSSGNTIINDALLDVEPMQHDESLKI